MPDLARTVFVLQLAATWYMTGLIWMVQVVHYPLFEQVGKSEFASYEQAHSRLTTWVVGPPMLIEAAACLLQWWWRPPGSRTWELTLGTLLLLAIWASTAFLQVPCHNRLMTGFDGAVHQRLVLTNWIRTGAWTLRGLLLLRPLAVG